MESRPKEKGDSRQSRPFVQWNESHLGEVTGTAEASFENAGDL